MTLNEEHLKSLNLSLEVMDNLSARNKFLLNQSLLLVGVAIALLINDDIKSVLNDSIALGLKASAIFFGTSVIFFTFSIFNFFSFSSGIAMTSIEEHESVKESLDEIIKIANIAVKMGKAGIWMWRLGLGVGLVTIIPIIYYL